MAEKKSKKIKTEEEAPKITPGKLNVYDLEGKASGAPTLATEQAKKKEADKITVTGVKGLHGAEHEVIPDRVEAATFAIAAALMRGPTSTPASRPYPSRSARAKKAP